MYMVVTEMPHTLTHIVCYS